ncbi:MAG: helix-turn-helix domain-containing protein, partial [Planctomycetaceae bacterium]|nr:helix-turn-helix domain-containing protein [Planctomycetaceae bacterium]
MFRKRYEMVAAYRRGKSIREVACLFHVGKSTVQRWVKHAGDQRLARVDF